MARARVSFAHRKGHAPVCGGAVDSCRSLVQAFVRHPLRAADRELAYRGVMSECAARARGRWSVTRAQMSGFLARTFGLTCAAPES